MILKKINQLKERTTIRIILIVLQGIVAVGTVFFLVGLLQSSLHNMDLNSAMNFFKEKKELFLVSSGVLLVLLLWLISLLGSFFAGYFPFLLIVSGIAVATKMKLEFRNETVYPEDFRTIFEFKMIKDLIGQRLLLLLLFLIVVIIGLCVYLFIKNFKKSFKYQIIRIVVFTLTSICLFFLWNFNTIKSPISDFITSKTNGWVLWDQTANYNVNGYVPAFLFNLKAKAMEKPQNYSRDRIQKITDKYSKIAQENNMGKQSEDPNVIYVMNESFSDMTKLNGIDISEDPIALYKNIADHTFSGSMLSPQYGGGTANVEFEALTSIPMSVLNPQVTIPYSMLVPQFKSFPSIVSFLKNHGYNTTAIHPYNTTMYKRKDAYKIFGFDQFLSEENTKFDQKRKDGFYFSDAAAYKVTIDQLKNEENPGFVHLVTMQNHMPYGSSFSDKEFVVNGVSSSPLTNYAQAMYESSVALENFLKELESLPRRSIVVFWGDHLPPLYDDNILNQNDEVTKFETPFMIYDTQHSLSDQSSHENVISPFYFASAVMNLAGLETDGFYELMTALHSEVSSFKREEYFYDNDWHKTLLKNSDASSTYSELNLITYDLLAGKKYSLETSFFK